MLEIDVSIEYPGAFDLKNMLEREIAALEKKKVRIKQRYEGVIGGIPTRTFNVLVQDSKKIRNFQRILDQIDAGLDAHKDIIMEKLGVTTDDKGGKNEEAPAG